MLQTSGSESTEVTATNDDGTSVIAANPALRGELEAQEQSRGPIDEQGRFTGHDVKGLTWERRWTTPGEIGRAHV